MTGHRAIVEVLTWNLFHGRDHPPEPGLHSWKSRWLRATELGERYAQVNRVLLPEFSAALARPGWDVALLQEAPPRWQRQLSVAARASSAISLTSRNFGAPLRRCLADLNTDLVGSDEGGSNQTLVRAPWRIAETRRMVLAQEPERRTMLFVRLAGPGGARLAVANLHASAHDPNVAIREVEAAAAQAIEWSHGDALVLGGDLNARPKLVPGAYERLEERHGLAPVTSRHGLDHLLARAPAEVVDAPAELPDSWRDFPGPAGRLIRISDHPPVRGVFATVG